MTTDFSKMFYAIELLCRIYREQTHADMSIPIFLNTPCINIMPCIRFYYPAITTMCVIFLFSFFCSFFCSWVWNPVLPIFCLFDNWEQTGWLFAGFSLCYHEVRPMSSTNRPWLNPLTPMNVQDRISPFNINYILGRKLMRMKKISRRGL